MMKQTKLGPGRPKTLDRTHVLEVAMMNYWSRGVTAVSVAEICRLANVSKPGLYREFGSEDGLKEAVLASYFNQVLGALFDILEQDRPFSDVVNDMINLASQERAANGIPNGCLLLDMTQTCDQLGALSQNAAQEYRAQMLRKFETWIAQAKENGEFTTPVTTQAAALYVNAQVNAATQLHKNGETSKTIRSFLQMALSVFGHSKNLSHEEQLV